MNSTNVANDNKRYLKMRREQYVQMVATHALRFAKKQQPTEAALRLEIDKVANDAPGGRLISSDYNKIVFICKDYLKQS